MLRNSPAHVGLVMVMMVRPQVTESPVRFSLLIAQHVFNLLTEFLWSSQDGFVDVDPEPCPDSFVAIGDLISEERDCDDWNPGI